MKFLFIVRGIPGCGKSTVASQLVDNSKNICEADHYFMNNGEYQFDATKLGDAHESCRRKCKLLMTIGVEKIAVSNTSTTKKEFAPYVDMAKEHGYTVFFIIVENRHNGQDVHNVPSEVKDAMRKRFTVSL